MDKRAELERVIAEAATVRLSEHALYKRAKVGSATWHRAKANPEGMSLRTLEKLETAISTKRAEVAAA